MFYESLEKGILDRVSYKHPDFTTKNEDKVFSYLYDIVHCNKKTLIEGDYDVDGLMCVMVMVSMFKTLGVTNYEIYPYHTRTHTLDPYAMHECLQGHYEYFVIGDTGSSDMSMLHVMARAGVKIILLDHHNTIYSYEDYPENVAIINTMIENRLLLKDYYQLSAGALCYCVAAKFSQLYYKIELLKESAYALTSLYADCMDMSSELNRSIYWRATSLRDSELPAYLKHFMNEYTVFGRRYIDFWYSPRINALFRSGNNDLINAYFFKENDSIALAKCIEMVNKIYESNRQLVAKASDIVQVEEFSNFVFSDLGSLNEYIPIDANKMYNYTGLIANRLSDRYNKIAVVICQTESFYKGSVRDKFGRKILQMFQRIGYANGHDAAFGFTVNLFDRDKFLSTLKALDKSASKIARLQPIVEVCNDVVPDSRLINDMALYNDFSGGSTPVAYIQKEMVGLEKTYSSYGYRYKWGEFSIQSNNPIDYGESLLLKPIKKRTVTLVL